jgi:hypothetical protein
MDSLGPRTVCNYQSDGINTRKPARSRPFVNRGRSTSHFATSPTPRPEETWHWCRRAPLLEEARWTAAQKSFHV